MKEIFFGRVAISYEELIEVYSVKMEKKIVRDLAKILELADWEVTFIPYSHHMIVQVYAPSLYYISALLAYADVYIYYTFEAMERVFQYPLPSLLVKILKQVAKFEKTTMSIMYGRVNGEIKWYLVLQTEPLEFRFILELDEYNRLEFFEKGQADLGLMKNTMQDMIALLNVSKRFFGVSTPTPDSIIEVIRKGGFYNVVRFEWDEERLIIRNHSRYREEEETARIEIPKDSFDYDVRLSGEGVVVQDRNDVARIFPNLGKRGFKEFYMLGGLYGSVEDSEYKLLASPLFVWGSSSSNVHFFNLIAMRTD